jgi:hypothetical protein
MPTSTMNYQEGFLLWLMTNMPDRDARAILLQSFIQTNGPLSETAGAKVRDLLAKPNA